MAASRGGWFVPALVSTVVALGAAGCGVGGAGTPMKNPGPARPGAKGRPSGVGAAGPRMGQRMNSSMGMRNGTAVGSPMGMGGGMGMGGRGAMHPMLSTAAGYLGISTTQLMTAMRNGQSLAQMAKAKGKSVSGLKAALIAQASKQIDQFVQGTWTRPFGVRSGATSKSTGTTGG